MAITFRDLKDAALSHVEMDTNLASYYLSSSVSGRTITFYKSGSDGNVISSSLELSDSDNQTLTIDGDQLSISNGNTVPIPTGSDTTYTAGTGLTLIGTEFSLQDPHFSGDYEDLTNKPTNVSTFTNDVGYITSSTDTTYTAGEGLTLTGTEFSLTDPHFSGDYEDLTNKPTNVSTFTNDAGYITSSVGTLYTAGEGLTLTGTEFSLTEAHFSGDYDDLINKPTVGLSLDTNNLTLTKLDGTTDVVDLTPYLDEDARAIASGVLDGVTGIVTFTRDDSTTFTLDLSALLDGSGLVTSVNGFDGVVVLTTDEIAEGTTNLYDKEVTLTGENITINGTYPNFQLTGSNGSVTSVNGQTGDVTLTIPTVPTNVSEFINDAGYITEDTNTQLSDADIAAFGYIKTYTDTNTQLSDADIAAFGYIKTYNETDTLQTVTTRGATTSTTITAANFITTSDKRLKSDIKPIQEGLETIKKFVSYEYVKDGVQDAGFLAQEVQEAIPYSIGEREDGFLTMRDRPVLAHMHKAILELEARLAAIEEKLQ